jgi:hypothetical protein
MKILHFAAENFARVPANLVKAERKLGHESYLATLYKTFQKYNDEDFCFDLPFVATDYLKLWKKYTSPQKSTLTNLRLRTNGPPVWKPAHALEALMIKARDRFWEPKVRAFLKSINIDSFDLIFLDGGLGFLRSGKIVRELRDQGKRIVICYYGSDLRTRGVIPQVDELAARRFTFEFDHTLFDPNLTFLLFPFELVKFEPPPRNHSHKVRIGHAPTNRGAKGTDAILEQLELLRKRFDIEIVLIENLPHAEALQLKASCDLFVDTVGELGYGVNSLEALALGLPTAVEILPDFEAVLGPHPFINVSANTIAEKLAPFIQSADLRAEWGKRGEAWVKTKHDPVRVASEILVQIGAYEAQRK